ncbi:Mannosyl-oligosaccharide alpha-1,2-mannosidase isoform A [Termitomyces sp. J132]|nr:Mannosyl-oligosaccharide alpha-1,2-mannosidase isoform A [Termitomyces sp. J132]
MLPARRPRIWVDPESAALPPASVPFIGRPLLRWITWAAISLVLVLVFGIFRFQTPEHHAYVPPPYIPGQHKSRLRPPPPLPWKHQGPRPGPSSPERPTVTDPKWSARADKVKQAFVHAYDGYRQHALPDDELRPISGTGINNLNGWGLTVFDALDTMWVMGLNDTFDDALEIIAGSTFISPRSDRFVPFFETVIRYLGGMLSAYALSGETVLLARADDLAVMLLPAFDTTSGFPMYAVDPQTGQIRAGWNGDNVLWSEALSNQLELTSGLFREGIHVLPLELRFAYYVPPDDIYPTLWDIETGRSSNDVFSVGAFADSAHEYLLKQWLLTSQSELKTREIYLRSINAVINNLLYLTPKRQLLYVTDTRDSIPSHTFEHLSCFFPGLLALGVHTLNLPPKERELHSWAAEGLARTCWATYLDTETGLGPDEVQMLPGVWNEGEKGLWIKHLGEWEKKGRQGNPPGIGEVEKAEEKEYIMKKQKYLLRPETLESFYILWRTTGQEIWRERGWTIFEAIERHARTEYGYANVDHVDRLPVEHIDEMPSWFLAETLKYLYLLFTDEDLLPLDEWVFNTEAHPLPIFKWKKWEKEKYGIPVTV